MKKAILFGVLSLLLCSIFVSCKSKAEMIYFDRDMDEVIYYCKNKDSVISLLKEEEIIDKYFNWEKDILDNKKSVDEEETLESIKKMQKYLLYRNFSYNIVDTLQEEEINHRYKDGFYIVLDIDLNEIEYLGYIEFINRAQVFSVSSASEFENASYIDMTKSWELDL